MTNATPGRAEATSVPWALIVAARLANAAFFLVTATYCLLTYSSFAYQQFIKPHLVNWLSEFVVWHHIGFWLVLGVTALTMVRELRQRRGRLIGAGYLAASAAAGVVLLVEPILPQVDNDGRGLILALIALVPPIWLSLYDLRVTSPQVPLPRPSSDRRVLYALLAAALVVWLAQTMTAPWRLPHTGEIVLTPAGVAFGAATSFVLHLVMFTALAIGLLAGIRLSRAFGGGGQSEYRMLVAVFIVAAAGVVKRLLFGAIAFDGPAAWAVACALALQLGLLWSSLAGRISAGDVPGASAVELFLRPLPGSRHRAASAAALAVLPMVSALVVARLMLFDWDFLLQKLFVLALWLAAFGYSFSVLRVAAELPWSRLSGPPLVAGLVFATHAYAQPRLPQWMGNPSFVPEFVLEGYVAVDPSFRLIQHVLHVDSLEDAAFYRELRSHSTIQHVELAPVDVDFVRPLEPARRPKPHVFLLVVDSLRRDYLEPYNPAVDFTPAIGAFAREATVFERTFTRYGGTGLSMPAMWTGGMVIHKQYVTPFGPMNTLEKLLDANGYRMALSLDHITALMVKPSPSILELDRGRPEMQYDVCRTLDELQATLRTEGARDAPVFAHTRSLNLHVAHVRSTPVPPGRVYDGFVPPVAAAVERIDACFGGFIEYLKREQLYDDSVIVLTSDHGDTLGESLSWGHALTIVPHVLRIPLIIRVPERFRKGLVADPGAITFSTDITPTLYELLGHQPDDLGPLFGAPLFVPEGTDLSGRRRETYLVASSYGAVYGVLRDNGRRLYVADAINSREYAYDMSEPAARRVGVTQQERSANRAFIREQLDRLARIYQFEPRN